MFDIPIKFIFIDPIYDIFLIIFITYIFLSFHYKEMIKDDVQNIKIIDIEISIIFLALGYLNYQGMKFNILNFQIDWWFYIFLVQFLVELFFLFLFKNNIKEYQRKLLENRLSLKISKIEKKIVNTELFKNFLENELEELKKKKKTKKNNLKIKNLKEDIKNIKNEIKDLRKELDKIEKK